MSWNSLKNTSPASLNSFLDAGQSVSMCGMSNMAEIQQLIDSKQRHHNRNSSVYISCLRLLISKYVFHYLLIYLLTYLLTYC